ncbi:MAG: signal peptidase I [Bacillota bacterium]|jgi:signal peptidase I|nr:signal peptidase I [Bacillota bacterium]
MRKVLQETLETVIIAAAIALLIRFFIVEPFRVDGPSMEPTFHTGDMLIVNKFGYRFSAPKRGDVIVFRYPRQPQKDYVKRVIAVAGETIEVRMGRLYVNGQLFEEGFTTKPSISSFPRTEVPSGSVFVLGDNRSNSEDSRYFGAVPLGNIKGRAMVVYWPIPRVQLITGG